MFIDISHSKEDYIIIIENNGKLENNKLNLTSLFDRSISTTENLIIVSRMTNTQLSHKPSFWGLGHYYNKYSFNNYNNVVLYSNPQINIDSIMTETFLDSLVKSKK